MLRMARKSGMTILLDGRIGKEAYMSVSGSTDALQRFAHDVRVSLLKRPKRTARAARSRNVNPLVTARMRERIAAGAHRWRTPHAPRLTLRGRSSSARCERR
ncbi:hypothetical protein [Caballeronia fortuita]|nr:hypothetical protein [Caballeronia fortuita]